MDKSFFPIGVCMWAEGNLSFGKDKAAAGQCFDFNFERLARCNCNVVSLNHLPFEFFGEACKAARKHNLKIIYAIPGTGKHEMEQNKKAWTRAEAEKILLPSIEVMRDAEELFCYYAVDEPNFDLDGLYVENLIRIREVVKSMDAERIVLSVYNTPAMTGQLFRRIRPEVLLIDPYVLCPESPLGHMSSLVSWIEYSRGIAGDTPLWLIPQAHGSSFGRRAPTPVEMRKMFYLYLAHGVTGLIYYIYMQTGIQDAFVDREGTPVDGRMDELGRLNQVAAKLVPILQSVKPTDHPSGTSDCEVEVTVLADKEWYRTFKTNTFHFFVVNNNVLQKKTGTCWCYNNADFGDNFNVLRGKEIISGKDVKFVFRAERGVISFDYELEPGEGKLYRVDTATDCRVGRKEMVQKECGACEPS